MKSRIKVRTDRLLEAVRAKRVGMIAAHERATTKYERDLHASRVPVANALRDAAERVEAGTFTPKQESYGDRNLAIPYRRTLPTKPRLETHRLDQTIAQLEMAAEDTVTINAEDFAAYLR